MKLFDDKDFLRNLLWLSLPVAAHNFIISSLNFIDNMMVGQLGEKSIAAIGVAGQFFFLLIVFMFGICSGASVFIAQFWGARDIIRIRHVLGISLVSSCLISLLFTFSGFFFPHVIADIFTSDSEVAALTIDYLKPVSLSFTVTAISFTFAFALRSTEKVVLPLIASSISVFINIFLNYGLIFGKFGMPEMGVKGAAVATLIARTFEMIFLISIIYRNGYEIAANLKDMFSFSREFIKRFINVASHVLYNEIAWAVGTVTYYWAYSQIGTESLAAVNISNAVERMAFVGFIGMCHGAAVIIGKKIGENETEKVFEYSRKLLFMSPLFAIFTGIIIFVLTETILSLYKISADVHIMARNLIFVLALIFPVKMYNMMGLVSILRSAGDTKYCFLIEGGAVWFIGVPMAILGLCSGLPVYMVYTMVNSEEIFKMIMIFRRFSAGNWVNRLVEAKVES